jgi:hypothetical protein
MHSFRSARPYEFSKLALLFNRTVFGIQMRAGDDTLGGTSFGAIRCGQACESKAAGNASDPRQLGP